MSTFEWLVVGFLGWLCVVGFVVLLVRGGALADRIEQPRIEGEALRGLPRKEQP